MDDILVIKDEQGGTAVLTINSPQSCYGLPILRIKTLDWEDDFGPADLLANLITAAEVVADWASQDGRTPEELKAAVAFLRQWPDGPQSRR